MSSLIDAYNDILKYNGNEIVIIIDQNEIIWFFANQIAKMLEYNKEGINMIVKNNVDAINKTTFGKLKEYANKNHDIQHHSIFINEAGLYEMMINSKKEKAKKFKRWITSEVIPTIRKTSKYSLDKSYEEKIKTLNKKLSQYKKRIGVLENNQKKTKYSNGGYVYIVKPTNVTDDMLKLGKTGNINKRLDTYNTSLPDNMKVIYKIKVDDPTAVEMCVKGHINHLRYRKNKEYYIIKKNKLIDIMKKCIRSINKSKNLKRAIQEPYAENLEYDETNEDDIYTIIGVNNEQMGGGMSLYLYNKNNYNRLKLIS